MPWLPPNLTARWPEYFRPEPADDAQLVTMAISAYNAKLVTRRAAVQRLQRTFNIENVDQFLDALEQESAERQAQAMQIAGAQAPDEAAPADQSKATETVATPDPAGASKDAKADPPRAAPATSAAPSQPVAKPTAAPKAPTPAKAGAIHERGPTTSGVTDVVYAQLAEDFPPDQLGWVRAASWQGPIDVPLDSIDMRNRADWAATDETDRVDEFVDKISGGEMKPIILVNEPNNEKLIVVDGHHRLLAYEQLGIPARAYVATVNAVTGPWDELHASQRKKKSS